ncbi:helix-turn-helix transcriptional regulator [Phyllobacterium sp. YR531]|uniref:AraC family transcriptional regulator n=1 Tax=Phyllobacterium sp. YR531 TaxID=1144343 RepID=UPI00026FB1F4|nr:helix-turn-helix transcriptional regulator [Phyllobacterium sp. YR531]EJN05829.1 DNA-binding domain-containing protein, AraC-type [Phyllobacterium sp. YR531]
MTASFASFDPDPGANPLTALRVSVLAQDQETPMHSHRSGQFILALTGALTCRVPGFIWIVPPDCAVWIPGNVPHSTRTTLNANVCFLFVKPGAATLSESPCTVKITPMVREMILHLADREHADQPADEHSGRLMQVLLEELEAMPRTRFGLPMSVHAKLKPIIEALTTDSTDRSTLSKWAEQAAMSERTLARLIIRETGMTFGRWRQQLRILMALRQLAEGNTVQQVADGLGYASTTAFITMFKKALGTTPGRYF